MNTSNPPCPACNSESTNKNGKRAGGTQRFLCRKCGHRFSELTAGIPLDEPEPQSREERRQDTHVFVLTYCQNNTPIHDGFWDALQSLVRKRNADLLVIKGRYRNPTGPKESKKADQKYWWDERSHEYLWDKREDLCGSLTILGDIRVQPTAVCPLTGLDSVTGGKSGILGHPKIELRTIATPQQALPKTMMTTGACTEQNYSDSKAGKKGEFHHAIGARIVEIRGNNFFTREINALRDGSFIDLDTEYFPDGTNQPAKPAEVLSLGDWHSGMTCPEVINATFGDEGSMCQVLKPKYLVWDDVLDQYGRNHHDKDDPFKSLAMYKDEQYDRGNLENEVLAACWELEHFTAEAERHTGASVTSVVNCSNHDEALTRWIKEGNWKTDPVNAEFYLRTALMMAESVDMKPGGHTCAEAFALWGKQECSSKIQFLGRNDSFYRLDIEHGMHGDVGPNGARGSIVNISKIGVKTVIGHSHTPGIVGGCYQKGTSTVLRLHYTRGPSSWMNSHVVTYANGKRAILTVIDGEWRHG